jgi:multidrug efflux pump subunit AcrA (membrane-fusion protein)
MRQRFLLVVLLLAAAVPLQNCRLMQGPNNGKQASTEPPKVAVDVVAVRLGEFVDELEVVGSLSPKNEAQVKSEYQGIIDKIFVSEWVRVKKGDPLAQLDTREIQVAIQRAKVQVEATRALLLQVERSGISNSTKP